MSRQAMRVFSTEFKQGVVLRLEGGERGQSLAVFQGSFKAAMRAFRVEAPTAPEMTLSPMT
jgi:hypothetical protein